MAIPAAGQCWIVAAEAEGDWAGKTDCLAVWTSGGWRFIAPVAGMLAWNKSASVWMRWTGASWSAGTLPATALVIGGLVREQDSLDTDKLPIIGDLPIVGALARSSTRTKNRSELVIVLTPHIMDDQPDVSRRVARGPILPADATQGSQKLEPGFVPVSHSEVEAHPGMLPKLQPVKVLGEYNHPANYTKQAGPASVKQGQSMLMMADDPATGNVPARVEILADEDDGVVVEGGAAEPLDGDRVDVSAG